MITQKDTYLQLAPSPDFFREDGDGLLWASLLAVATNKPFEVEEYIREDGQVFRNPGMALGRLLGPRESTISRDMFMGLFCYCLHFRRSDILENIWAYGWKHGWRMGAENRVVSVPIPGTRWAVRIRDNRTWFTPGLILLLYAILAHLRGRPRLAKLLAGIWQPLSTTPGYQSHLAMLHIYLNLRIRGKTSTSEQSVLRTILERSPRNALALALAGWKEEAVHELEATWPLGRLPTHEDWTEGWRTQRADNDTGLIGRPGDTRQHSGGDLLFVHHVLAL